MSFSSPDLGYDSTPSSSALRSSTPLPKKRSEILTTESYRLYSPEEQQKIHLRIGELQNQIRDLEEEIAQRKLCLDEQQSSTLRNGKVFSEIAHVRSDLSIEHQERINEDFELFIKYKLQCSKLKSEISSIENSIASEEIKRSKFEDENDFIDKFEDITAFNFVFPSLKVRSIKTDQFLSDAIDEQLHQIVNQHKALNKIEEPKIISELQSEAMNSFVIACKSQCKGRPFAKQLLEADVSHLQKMNSQVTLQLKRLESDIRDERRSLGLIETQQAQQATDQESRMQRLKMEKKQLEQESLAKISKIKEKIDETAEEYDRIEQEFISLGNDTFLCGSSSILNAVENEFVTSDQLDEEKEEEDANFDFSDEEPNETDLIEQRNSLQDEILELQKQIDEKKREASHYQKQLMKTIMKMKQRLNENQKQSLQQAEEESFSSSEVHNQITDILGKIDQSIYDLKKSIDG